MTDPATVRTTCPYCGVGCGVLATPEPDGSVTIVGDPDHPANFGRLCSKGAALGDTLSLAGRQLYPEIDSKRVAWGEALDLVAGTFARATAEHGPDAVAFYGSGQLLTEDYYVANKLMKGFIGSANIDTNSRLCMASSVAGHKRAFGSDTVPGNYEDLELADLVVLVGSNLAWCHPVLYQRLVKAKAERPQMRIVLIDPRRTNTAEQADLHLPIRADGDTTLFVGLLKALADSDALDPDFIAASTNGFDTALDIAAPWTLERVAAATALEPAAIASFYDWFATTSKVVTVFSQGVNQSATGTDKVNAIINCHLATGRIGRPGMGPFSVTGQPNAMGGREVGGLANMLAAHMDFAPDNVERLQRFWHSDRVAHAPGLKAVDLFDAIASGRIKAVWIMATNPVDSMPEADRVRAALRACPFVVVSDIHATADTMLEADVRLPAAGWGEKNGTVTNSERRISRQRHFLELPGEARPDWWIVTEIARRLGFAEAFPYRSAAEIFAEHVALTAFENLGTRDFDLSGLAGRDYEQLTPVQWPVTATGTPRMFTAGRFFTPDGRANFVPIAPPPPIQPSPGQFILNTGRVRDHWHTMTRTGKTARLSAHLAEPFVEIHPRDAAAQSIRDAALVRIENRHGSALVRALVTDRQRPGQIFVPMHWTDEFASNARIDALVSARTDPVSGQPALKMSLVSLAPHKTAIYGFFVARERPSLAGLDYWAVAEAEQGIRGELGFGVEPPDWKQWIATAFGLPEATDLVSAIDARSGRRSYALVESGRLAFALFLSPDPVLVARQWLVGELAPSKVDGAAIVAGRPGADVPDIGAIICACMQIGSLTIDDAVRRHGCTTVEAVGALTEAGTNCGSCRAEIRAIIESARLVAAE
ncbi:MAG: molybdopterin-dependent oxidoreductase [Devosia sp.]